MRQLNICVIGRILGDCEDSSLMLSFVQDEQEGRQEFADRVIPQIQKQFADYLYEERYLNITKRQKARLVNEKEHGCEVFINLVIASETPLWIVAS